MNKYENNIRWRYWIKMWHMIGVHVAGGDEKFIAHADRDACAICSGRCFCGDVDDPFIWTV